jgi:hypothetical protein
MQVILTEGRAVPQVKSALDFGRGQGLFSDNNHKLQDWVDD